MNSKTVTLTVLLLQMDGLKSGKQLKEKRIVGEGGDVPEETVSSWIEKLQELTEEYSSENIWNMDESGCFFKALPDAGLVQKGKKKQKA